MPKYRRRFKIELETKEYKYGFYTELEADTSHWLERRYCSCYFDEKEEPQWMTGVSSLFVLGRK
jgi:Fe-S cluster assembly protein SufB